MNFDISLPRRATFPLEFYDRVPFIRVQHQGEEKLFIFDSGAQDIILNSTYLPANDSSDVGYGMGATGTVAHQYVPLGGLRIGDWVIGDREVLSYDMTHIAEEYGTEVHGLMGFRQLIYFDWMVDYEKGELHLWDRFPKSKHELAGKVQANYRDHLPMVKIRIGEEEYKMLIDTGAGMFVMVNENKERVMPHVEDEGTKQMASASPVEQEVGKGVLKGFQIGDLDFGPCEINFMDLSHMQRGFGTDIDGIVGHSVLSQYRTVVCWSYHAMYFLKD